jgi:hypothetical protein
MASTIRGKLIKTPDATPGILFVNGRQKPFQIEGIWQSPVAPAANMTVDVELIETGGILGLRAVPDSQLAQEQAALALGSASEKGRVLASSVTAQVGKPALVATGLLIIGWFFLDWLSITVPFMGTKLHFTFWHFLGWLNFLQDAVGNPLQILLQGAKPEAGAGIYGFLAVIALAGPFLTIFWKDRRAMLGGLLPMVFTLFIALQVLRFGQTAQEATTQVGLSPLAQAQMAQQAKAAQEQVLNAFSLGLGWYLSGLATLYLAGSAVVKYLARKA